MTLLDEVLEAHGGLAHWRDMRRFVVHMSIDGSLLESKGWGGALREMVVEGQSLEPYLRMTGFGAVGQVGFYSPDWILLQQLDGTVLGEWTGPPAALAGQVDERQWSAQELAFFCGYRIWHDLGAPFLFAGPGVRCEDAGLWHESGETWRRLRIGFENDVLCTREQHLYIDANCLQRRLDYAAREAGERMVAQYTWAHQSFSGIVIPTLRRSLLLGADGRPDPAVELLRSEIFDARFE
ncbi:hypothetical protein FHT86_000756 [Rhizobium sp. BK313]|uniref:hypothetical protein n=1 Tax=Rhizobium sp. BK313 TaxID=2587081 RepID=UPI00105FA089|nr:hypothetical protein [Rhizobium sp. BK313]MBB3452500.1 hypothetical protein [Rhizobium sp. BK313]